MAANLEYQALKKFENEIIECLEGVDLISLARQAAERKLVPREVKEHIKSLHSEVPHPLVCRYLLFYVYDSVKTKKRQFDFWLKELSKFEGTEGVLSQLKERGNLCSLQLKQVVFTKRHVPYLTEVLANCSSKWQEIGTALRLPDNEIKNIMAMTFKYTPIMCLKEVISGWVLCKYSDAASPTLESLQTALSSKIVGLGDLASQLREKMDRLLPECTRTSEAEKFEIMYSDAASPTLQTALSSRTVGLGLPECTQTDEKKAFEKFEIISQTQNEMIKEGQAVLLEVFATNPFKLTRLNSAWSKDGKMIKGPSMVEDSYEGYHTSILYLEVSDLLVEGLYKCHFKTTNAKVVLTSNSIFLRVATPIDKYKKKLVSFYTEQPEVPEDTWPPVSSNTYISLALIKQSNIYYAGEYGRVTIHGDADDIYKDKESIEYEKAFSNIESGTRLLMEGRPGSGKTTLVHKVSQDWAIENLVVKATRILLLVHLRAFFSDPNIDMKSIFNCYFQESSIKKLLKYAQKHNGLGFCFILDGLDEYSPHSMKESFIFKLIKKLALPCAIVIVASRPAAVADFRSVASIRVEVLGFFKDQISDYIDNYLFTGLDLEKRKKLREYLSQHPNVHHMCYLPIHAAMVCFLYNLLEADLPQTETEIYKEFTKFTILRILYRSDENSDVCLNFIEDLVGLQKRSILVFASLPLKCVSQRSK